MAFDQDHKLYTDTNVYQDPLYLEVAESLENVRLRLMEIIEESQKWLKACKVNNVIQAKITQELKQKEELETRLAELNKKQDDIDKICANFLSGVTISESDRSRLENAKKMQEIGKKLTGVRFDYSAPPDVIKGYIKYEYARSLTPFELPAGASESLWTLLETVTDNKENRHHN